MPSGDSVARGAVGYARVSDIVAMTVEGHPAALSVRVGSSERWASSACFKGCFRVATGVRSLGRAESLVLSGDASGN